MLGKRRIQYFRLLHDAKQSSLRRTYSLMALCLFCVINAFAQNVKVTGRVTDEAEEAALLRRGSRKRCAVCGAFFFPKSNRGKYCPDCAGRMKRINAAKRKRKQREKCHALGHFKPA